MEHLPVDDASVDVVTANMALHHAPRPAAAIREMVRTLKPGGRLVITDATQHTYEWFKQEMADVWLGFSRQEIEIWYAEAGLRDIRYDLVGRR
jgi:ubiquinone/menaquinone biosynthesis C-methylase UbiE